MKAFNSILVVIVFWSMAIVPAICQNTLEKTLVKSFSLNGKTILKVDLPSVADVKTWNEPTARIEMVVAVENMSEAMLKSLIVAGRYNVMNQYEATHMTLNAPAMQRTIKLNGQEIKETVRYTLYVPSDVVIAQNGSSKQTGVQ
jgi:hypothetical protein